MQRPKRPPKRGRRRVLMQAVGRLRWEGGDGYLGIIPGLKWLGSPPFISHETAIWKGSNNPILRGRKVTMVINHLLTGIAQSLWKTCACWRSIFTDSTIVNHRDKNPPFREYVFFPTTFSSKSNKMVGLRKLLSFWEVGLFSGGTGCVSFRECRWFLHESTLAML